MYIILLKYLSHFSELLVRKMENMFQCLTSPFFVLRNLHVGHSHNDSLIFHKEIVPFGFALPPPPPQIGNPAGTTARVHSM